MTARTFTRSLRAIGCGALVAVALAATGVGMAAPPSPGALATVYTGSIQMATICTIVGTPGHDFLWGTAGPDVICGLGGDDSIGGASGNDVIYAGEGHDTLYGGTGNDVLHGQGGYDNIDGQAGTDVAYGGSGIDACNAETAYCEI